MFNLVNPAHGDSWNCMSDLGGDTLLAQVLTNVIIRNTSEGKGDHFWDNGEANLLKALGALRRPRPEQDAGREEPRFGLPDADTQQRAPAYGAI